MNSKHAILDGLNEEFYQISRDILGSFNKYRPPLNIFHFKEEVARVVPYYKVGDRLSNEQVDELATLTDQGMIFVSRDDHPVYVKHISYQLDLVLVDANLKEKEIADIFVQALTRRMKEFLEQPVAAVLEKLWSDLMVLTEYLYSDISRTKALIRRLHDEHTLENHSVNCGLLGLAVLARMQGSGGIETNVSRKQFDRITAGLFLHDIGMTKVPLFLREKDKPLQPDERNKVNQHTNSGFEMLTRLNLRYAEIEQCVTQHHERVNGSGYPLKAMKQDLIGRLCAVADSFCAMVVKRPFAPAKEYLKAAAELGADAGYDKSIVKALQMVLVVDLKLKP